MSEINNNPGGTHLDVMTTILAKYREVLGILNQTDITPVAAMDAIRPHIAQIEMFEQEIAPVRSELAAGKRVCCEKSSHLIGATVSVLEEILPLLEKLGKQTRESLAKLFPDVQRSVQGLEMKSAYGKSVHVERVSR